MRALPPRWPCTKPGAGNGTGLPATRSSGCHPGSCRILLLLHLEAHSSSATWVLLGTAPHTSMPLPHEWRCPCDRLPPSVSSGTGLRPNRDQFQFHLRSMAPLPLWSRSGHLSECHSDSRFFCRTFRNQNRGEISLCRGWLSCFGAVSAVFPVTGGQRNPWEMEGKKNEGGTESCRKKALLNARRFSQCSGSWLHPFPKACSFLGATR